MLRCLGGGPNLREKFLGHRKNGSLWIATQSIAAYSAGGAVPDSWQLCVKRGAGGKDAKQ